MNKFKNAHHLQTRLIDLHENPSTLEEKHKEDLEEEVEINEPSTSSEKEKDERVYIIKDKGESPTKDLTSINLCQK